MAPDFGITRFFPDIKSFARDKTFFKIGKGVVLISLYEALTLILTSNIKLTFSHFFGSNVEILNTFALIQYVTLAWLLLF